MVLELPPIHKRPGPKATPDTVERIKELALEQLADGGRPLDATCALKKATADKDGGVER